jgi:16S rRNA (cytidine1402-2'-O)-methyltransferase
MGEGGGMDPTGGKFIICGTPIGNMGDMGQRAIETLASADVVYAEDTRVTRKLLSRFGISVPLVRCDELVTLQRIPEIVERVLGGQTVVLVSDAGMPCISDPGQRVVKAVRAKGGRVEVVPGPSAVLTALAGSGFLFKNFYFGGFLPRKPGERTRLLESLAGLDTVLVFFDSNHRTQTSIEALGEALPGRRICMARELTKIHEEYLVGTAKELVAELDARPGELKGEVVLVVEAPDEARLRAGVWPAGAIAAPSDEDMRAEASRLVNEEGMKASQAAKELVARYGIDRDTAYDIARAART